MRKLTRYVSVLLLAAMLVGCKSDVTEKSGDVELIILCGSSFVNPTNQLIEEFTAQYPGIKPLKMDGDIFLFDLEQDISELSNVAGSHPEVVEELEKEYNAFISSLGRNK